MSLPPTAGTDPMPDAVLPGLLPGYVPEPQPAGTDYLIGAHYFPGWYEGRHFGWGKVTPHPERMPLLGCYDEGDPEVADWEILWALEHGLSYFVYCWYREKASTGRPLTPADAWLGHAIHDGLLRARHGDRFRFAIMWENSPYAGGIADLADLRDNLVPFWIDQYIARPNYLRLAGRPVLFIYDYRTLERQAGGAEGACQALATIRAAFVARGQGDPLILGEHRSNNPAFLAQLAAVGFDLAFAYCWHPPGARPVATEAIAFQLRMLDGFLHGQALPAIATAGVGWDPYAWREETPEGQKRSWWLDPAKMTRWYSRPGEFRQLLEQVKQRLDALPDAHPGRRMLLLDNWNEWGEGHFIAPSAAGGFGYLQAVREVFTRRDNLPDYRPPALIGRGPYDRRWRASGQPRAQ